MNRFDPFRRVAVLALLALLAGCATRVMERGADSEAPIGKALTFQRKSLSPTDGGRLIAPADLQIGDILLSADPGLASAGIRLLTTSPVSHASIYVGDGEVAEALRGGVRLRAMPRVLQEESVIAVFRHPALDEERALQRRVCELPGVPTLLRETCLSTLATLQLIHGGDDRFFCSQFVLESYREAGLPLTRARPHWVSPEDIMHMRAGDVSSLPVEQPLMYVGHLKFTPLAMPLPGLAIPLPAPAGETRTPR